MQRTGAQVLEVLDNETYLARADDLVSLQTLSFIHSVHPFVPVIALAGDRSKWTVDISLHGDVKSERIADEIAKIVPLSVRVRAKFRATIDTGQRDRLQRLDAVRRIELVAVPRLAPILGDQAVRESSLRGRGQTISVCDTGFAAGNPREVPLAISKLYALGRATASDPDGHGTKICELIRALSPSATLLVQSVLDEDGGLGGIPADIHDLLYPPYADGARVHCNAWVEEHQAYTQSSRELDQFLAQYRDLVVLHAGTKARNCIVTDTPAAASAMAAGMREFLSFEGLKRPSAALIRALMAIGDAYTLQRARFIRYHDENQRLDTGDAISVTVTTPALPVEVALAWTDLPGDVLQNELTLEVLVGGVVYKSTGEANLRRVRAPGGAIVITVKGRRNLAPQSFALVVYAGKPTRDIGSGCASR